MIRQAGRWTLLAAAAGFGAMALAGCIQRTITINSQPQGAVVHLNDVEVGRTPTRLPFTFYGTYDVRLAKDGYQTLHVARQAKAPWWDNPGPDIVAEALPGQRKVNLEWHFVLDAMPPTDEALTLDRARQMWALLRQEAGENGAAGAADTTADQASAAADDASEPPLALQVSILEDGTLLEAGEAVTLEQLQQRLRARASDQREAAVALNVEPGVPYQRVVSLMDAIRAAGIQQVHLAAGGAEPGAADDAEPDGSGEADAGGTAGEADAQAVELRVGVKADGSLEYAGEAVTLEQLQANLRSAVAETSNVAVVVDADQAAAYERVVEVLNAVQAAGVQEVSITRPAAE